MDIGIALVPPIRNHNWAMGNYTVMRDVWQAELEKIVGRHVSLVAMVPGNDGDEVVRSTGICLWKV